MIDLLFLAIPLAYLVAVYGSRTIGPGLREQAPLQFDASIDPLKLYLALIVLTPALLNLKYPINIIGGAFVFVIVLILYYSLWKVTKNSKIYVAGFIFSLPLTIVLTSAFSFSASAYGGMGTENYIFPYYWYYTDDVITSLDTILKPILQLLNHLALHSTLFFPVTAITAYIKEQTSITE
ncbi:MAG: hypothetical protein MUP66_03840 [Candidatus Nanohaloarchaeota archaeon QJJ-5]|nr:hypothetical protein [Candidatus Nanohaloarchaeota archaeon QJJ-5]